MTETTTIPSRFRGPAASGNGGYTCGLVAGLIEGDAETTLRAPPPLECSLWVERTDRAVALFDDEILVAEARAAEWSLEVPPPPTLEQAIAAAARYAGFKHHAFP